MIRNAPELGTTWAQNRVLLDHLVRPRQQRRRDREAEGLGGLEVDHQLELRGLLDGQVGGLGALGDLVDASGVPFVPGEARLLRAPSLETRRTWGSPRSSA
jgi:hypothetical protein